MLEYASVSASSYDPAALVARLNEKSAEGWSVVSIVGTGSDVTAFLSRESGVAAGVAASAVTSASSTVAAAQVAVEPVAATPVVASPAAAEPAGWAVAPQPVSQPVVQQQVEQPSVPAQWAADPMNRFELRYWDGTRWTEHVSRAGQQYVDPL